MAFSSILCKGEYNRCAVYINTDSSFGLSLEIEDIHSWACRLLCVVISPTCAFVAAQRGYVCYALVLCSQGLWKQWKATCLAPAVLLSRLLYMEDDSCRGNLAKGTFLSCGYEVGPGWHVMRHHVANLSDRLHFTFSWMQQRLASSATLCTWLSEDVAI